MCFFSHHVIGGVFVGQNSVSQECTQLIFQVCVFCTLSCDLHFSNSIQMRWRFEFDLISSLHFANFFFMQIKATQNGVKESIYTCCIFKTLGFCLGHFLFYYDLLFFFFIYWNNSSRSGFTVSSVILGTTSLVKIIFKLVCK